MLHYVFRLLKKSLSNLTPPSVDNNPLDAPPYESPSIARALLNFTVQTFGGKIVPTTTGTAGSTSDCDVDVDDDGDDREGTDLPASWNSKIEMAQLVVKCLNHWFMDTPAQFRGSCTDEDSIVSSISMRRDVTRRN